MADRKMTLQEKLAAARAGGPAKPQGEADRDVSPPEVTQSAEPADVSASPAPVAAAPVPTPSELGRPLTLKEKLAAARAGAAPPAAAPPPAATSASAAEPSAPASGAAPVVPPPAAPLGRPLTMQEKLAAARGAGTPASGAATASGPKPAAAKAAPAAQAASTRPLPPLEKSDDPKDLAEHLRRAGVAKEQASKAAVAAASPAPARPATKRTPESKVVPPRPDRAAATAATRPGPTRRQVLTGTVVGALSSWFFWGWATFAAANVAFLTACARFMFPNVLNEPPSTIKVGLPGNFEKGEVNERWKAEWGFWIVRSDYYDGIDKLYALSTICTHLGCPPNWLAGEQKFKCPCHGSGYYISGVNFEGPAPRPLERFKVSVGDDGQMVVDKSRKFQAELGQWEDPDSYVQA